MLPKPDKTKKGVKTEQLDLVETLDSAKKIKRKRFWLILTLCLTIGLSLIFWVYYSLARHFFQLTPTPRLKFTLDRLITPDTSSWSIYLKSGDFVWSQNFNQNPDSLIKQLEKTKLVADSLLKNTLPSGAEIKEIITAPSVSYQIFVPGKTITLLLTLPSSDMSRIPSLVEKIYWAVIRN